MSWSSATLNLTRRLILWAMGPSSNLASSRSCSSQSWVRKDACASKSAQRL
ncbi:hypothetical protein PF005_g1547 [Phytophthora fragariae]|uniref:Uncharacterized protein n=1 Tax=Phytophthora fragariae TaxID=53985 RepID=A0A6A3L609_9STRA|nr:hypothetical protein PF003_g1899 [Phytophthora fragariae]KAE8945970.1 hypothetical protein PF009_g4382 [Phytophthora fragariae]KAE9011143.1 hypothetical protein PF011_g9501 [Phytophthora fragariae]KAE9131415.1 hypothetical protein PF010_g3499 [Phytophthora fragariae]KAE9131502.1 hypothetical protein PF007_g4111 [Phytophthora fragariae]